MATKNKMIKMPEKQPGITAHMKDVLELLGEDASREGLVRTPERYEKALRFITSGYHTNLQEIVNGALFHVECDEMVVLKDIEFFSTCEHHVLPFFGKMHVAYLPKDKVLGLSKIPRIVDLFVRKLPSIVLVMVLEPCFSTPRIIMQKCWASHRTPTPRGLITSEIASATCCVKRS